MRMIRLADLASKKASSISSLRTNLSQKGFSIIQIDDVLYQQHIQAGLNEASRMTGFRFPPIDNNNNHDNNNNTTSKYNESKRQCFQTLFHIGIITFQALTHKTPLPTSLQNALQNYKHMSLFGSNNFKSKEEPFHSPNDPFAHSFFNLFSYSNGMLNSHKDRGLVTVIAARIPYSHHQQQQQQRSALWVKAPYTLPHQNNNNDDISKPPIWFNIDQLLQQLQQKQQTSSKDNRNNTSDKQHVVILLGQDTEKLKVSNMYNLQAAEHSVRVDPNGDFVSRSHYRSDPATTTAAITTTTTTDDETDFNRLSAALILRHDF